MAATLLSYAAYGRPFLEASILYHLGRADHRHNYAIWWHSLYLLYDDCHATGVVDCRAEEGGGWQATTLGLGAMLPLAGFIMLTAFGLLYRDIPTMTFVRIEEHDGRSEIEKLRRAGRYHDRLLRRLPLCLFVTTATFVHANKVLTAQYFVWYLALLPLITPRLKFQSRGLTKLALAAVTLWVAALLSWLGFAYRLEFLGHDVWMALWLASMFFFVTSMGLIALIVRAHKEESL